jgi:hypothetical protein
MHSPFSAGARALLPLLVAGVTACTGSPSSPSDTPAASLAGAAINVLDGSAATGLELRVGGDTYRTDQGGRFSVPLDPAQSHSAVISGAAIVERRTTIGGSSSGSATVSVIPASFDLVAFDEMFRSSGALRRWNKRPALVVLGSVMSYRGIAESYTATAERMTDDEVSSMIADLTQALSLLTGGAFTSFASVTMERPASGERAPVFRDDTIVVGRYNGIVTFASTIGYGTWADGPDGSVVGGAMFLDRDFDRDDPRRPLLRTHELGHALGYMHVESRVSIMNPSIGPEPTPFDRAAAIVAFQRPLGNRAPDTDPTFSAPPSGFGRIRWATPVPCRLAM